ncbi:MAG: biopolymer transporter ExbD [Hellea sp.]|nr:biopolymer transporter ExbD [Hellea sp.]
MNVDRSSSSSGRRTRRRKIERDINVTPLVDVMLVLLLVFMMTAATLLPVVDLELPKTDSQATSIEQDPVIVSIRQDGSLYLQDEQIFADTLVDRLSALATKGFEEKIYLQGDATADYELVVDVLSNIRDAGYSNINLVTDMKSDE